MPDDTTDHFDFSEKMQVGLLRAFCRVDFFEKHFDTARPEHFENELLTFLAETILNWQRKYHADMPKEVLVEEIRKAHPQRQARALEAGGRLGFGDIKSFEDVSDIGATVDSIVNEVYECKVPTKYIDANYREWARHQAMGNAAIQMVKLYRDRKYQDMHRVMADAFFSTDGYELGHMFLGGGEDRAKRRLTEKAERIPTMIQQLDHMLRGGGERKTLAVIMGKPKKGKSFCLVNIGRGAVVMGYRVVHYTLEMSEERVADRYDALFSGIRTEELTGQSEQLVAAIERAKEKHGESLVIKEYPGHGCTVDTIRAHQKRLLAGGFSTDVVIVDYADLLKSVSHYEQRWIELKDIFEDLKGLATENNLLVWAASTVHRKQVDKRVAHIEDAGGAYDKMFVADVIITLNQSDDEKRRNKMRIFLAAARSLPDGKEIEVETDFDHARFAKPESFDEDEFVEKRKDLYG